jgi:formate-dependent nitrite reductase membrane component NrfD
MSAAASFLLLLSLIFSFDPISGYFNGGALPTLFIIIYVSGAVASVVVPLVIRTNEKTVVADVPSKSITNAQAILSILCIFAGLVIILLNPSISSDAYLFIALGGVCFGLYFLIADSKPHGESRFLKLGLLAPTLALPYGIFFGNNSNFARHINSVENALCAIFCIFICAYIYNKGRNISDPKVTKWQLGFNLAAVFSGIAFSIPYILAFLYRFRQKL